MNEDRALFDLNPNETEVAIEKEKTRRRESILERFFGDMRSEHKCAVLIIATIAGTFSILVGCITFYSIIEIMEHVK